MDIQIPGYQIEGELGEGAMATVFLATQTSLERKVALKVMSAALAADTTFCERFLREGKMLAKLSHPHTVTIHDIGNVGNVYYMAMEYLPGGTLKEKIRAGLLPEQGIVYVRQIAEALGYAHAQGLVHRDVKPANILFRANGSAVLSDFGIAKTLGEGTQFTQAGFSVGTPSYMSPEQARGLDLDGRADLYALGVVLYELLTGKLPYTGTDSLSTALAHMTQPLPELPITQGRYQEVLRKLLAKDPADRYPDAAALIAALDSLPSRAALAAADDSGATVVRPAVSQPAARGGEGSALGSSDVGSSDVGGSGLGSRGVGASGLGASDLGSAGAAVNAPAPVTEPPAKPLTPAQKSKGPVALVAAVAAAVLLALGGTGYWLMGQDSKTATTSGATEPASVGADADALKQERGASESALQPEAPNINDKPLLMAGKKSLFQRVLSKPGAALFDGPGGTKTADELPAFSVFYVYERKRVAGVNWLEVGAASDGRRDGWLPESVLSDWKQTLVLKFTERSGRAPVMFMKDAATVESLLNDQAAAQATLNRAVAGGEGPVLALEPVKNAIPAEQFYLLPIFDAKESFDANGQPVQLLNVASIDPGTSKAPGAQVVGAKSANPDAFRTGIVLVVDTSVSMQPYLDKVRQVVDKLYGDIKKRGDLDSVSFGLVGFRSNTTKTPGLEYVTQTLVSLDEGRDPAKFLAKTASLKATTVSSHSFNEDAFAGIADAVDGMDWSRYGGRIILLVSDAGALRKNDPLGRTQMNEAELREKALSKQIKIYALHLRTEAGAKAKNHGFAESQYRALSADSNPQIGDLYIPVEDGDVNAFGDTVTEIGEVFADLVHDVASGRPQALPELKDGPSIAEKSAAIGYAMQMEFLGRKNTSHAPELVTAWTADRDLVHPQLPAFQICVLLTKLQLNDLQQSLKLIVDAARRTQSSPKDFFAEIASASAHMSRDPAKLSRGSNLAQGGALGEYLEGLPYRSKALTMTQELWLSLSVAEQQDFIDELDSKIRLYETFHNDEANWVRFGTAEPGDALYRVPLSTLP